MVSDRVDNFHAPFLRSNWQSAFDDVRVVTRERERENLKNARQIAGLQDFEFEAIFGLEEPGIIGWLYRNEFHTFMGNSVRLLEYFSRWGIQMEKDFLVRWGTMYIEHSVLSSYLLFFSF